MEYSYICIPKDLILNWEIWDHTGVNIVPGKTTASLPKVKFPKRMVFMSTKNHWSNEDKTKEYIELIIATTYLT